MFAQKSKKPTSVNELLGTVDAMRDQIASLRTERAAIENAPRPLVDVTNELDEHLDFLATASVDALGLNSIRARGAAVELKASAPIAIGLLVAIAREPLRRILEDQLSDLEQARPGMTDQDRQARLDEIDKALLQAERTTAMWSKAVAAANASIGAAPAPATDTPSANPFMNDAERAALRGAAGLAGAAMADLATKGVRHE